MRPSSPSWGEPAPEVKRGARGAALAQPQPLPQPPPLLLAAAAAAAAAREHRAWHGCGDARIVTASCSGPSPRPIRARLRLGGARGEGGIQNYNPPSDTWRRAMRHLHRWVRARRCRRGPNQVVCASPPSAREAPLATDGTPLLATGDRADEDRISYLCTFTVRRVLHRDPAVPCSSSPLAY
eukprot:scaffold1890_cov380-Prasinococcus_capsulatus_cf.AAC.9